MTMATKKRKTTTKRKPAKRRTPARDSKGRFKKKR